MQNQANRYVSCLLVFSLLLGLITACQPQPSSQLKHSVDDVFLLMISSRSLILNTVEETASLHSLAVGLSGVALASRLANPNRNEIRALIQAHTDFYQKNRQKIMEQYGGDPDLLAKLDQEFQGRMGELEQRAQALDQHRSRRGSVFGRVAKSIARLVVTPVKVVFKGAKYVVTVIGPIVVREFVQQKIEALRNLIRGKIKMAFEKLIAGLDPEVQVILRELAEPVLRRKTDQLLRFLKLSPKQAQSASAPQTCEKGAAWIDDYMKSVTEDLKAERRQCNERLIKLYQGCLKDQVNYMDVCKEEAIQKCEDQLAKIPINDPGGIISRRGDTGYAWGPPPDYLNLTYPSAGGDVTGEGYVRGTENDTCVMEIRVSLTGSYSPATCQMSGQAHYIFTCTETEKNGCVLCKGQEFDTTWTATLSDGEVRGRVNETSILITIPIVGSKAVILEP